MGLECLHHVIRYDYPFFGTGREVEAWIPEVSIVLASCSVSLHRDLNVKWFPRFLSFSPAPSTCWGDFVISEMELRWQNDVTRPGPWWLYLFLVLVWAPCFPVDRSVTSWPPLPRTWTNLFLLPCFLCHDDLRPSWNTTPRSVWRNHGSGNELVHVSGRGGQLVMLATTMVSDASHETGEISQ